MSDNYLIAQEVLTRNWCVFPCRPDEKLITRNSYKKATHDVQQIIGRWKEKPQTKAGIPCEMNNYFSLDLNRKNCADVIANIQFFAKEHYADKVKTKLRRGTPPGGLYSLFNLMENMDISQSTRMLAPQETRYFTELGRLRAQAVRQGRHEVARPFAALILNRVMKLMDCNDFDFIECPDVKVLLWQ